MILSEIKTYVVVMSFYMKMMKRRTLQPCSLRHSIKKACFLFRANWTCLNWAGGRIPPPPPWLCACIFVLGQIVNKNCFDHILIKLFRHFDNLKANYWKNADFFHQQHCNKQHHAKQHAEAELLTKMSKKQVCLLQWDFMINYTENENDNKIT